MENAILKKRITEFLSTEKSGDGKHLGKVFKDNLAKFISDIVFEEVKLVQDSIPMKETIPEADASVMKSFRHDVGDEVFYVIFKQGRSQVKGKLQLVFGWQFAVLRGKTEEIQIRADHGILYKVNGDWILQDLVFKKEEDAVARCNQLNSGIESFAVKEAEKEEPVFEEELPADDAETEEGGEVDGNEENGDNNGEETESTEKAEDGATTDDVGSAQVGSDSDGESDAAREGAV